VVGGIGFAGLQVGKSHWAELGYWLAKPYWNLGVMTEAVKIVSNFAFKEFGLQRITAHVFSFNLGSARVLEKAGFQCEGVLRQHYKKDGKIFDGKLYAKVKSPS
jgi:RimJ/RimL family protein N-acetyltransferase